MAKEIDNNDTRELIGFYQMGLDSIIQGDYSITCFDGKDSSWIDEEVTELLTDYTVKVGIYDSDDKMWDGYGEIMLHPLY